MPTTSTLEFVAKVKADAQTKHTPETRVVTDLPTGKYIRQGDVYLRRMPLEDLDNYGQLKELEGRQVVTDDNSVGSRHVVRPGTSRLFKRLDQSSPLVGPVIHAPDGLYLEHPKHGDFDIRQPGCYEVSFPRDMASDELQRLRD